MKFHLFFLLGAALLLPVFSACAISPQVLDSTDYGKEFREGSANGLRGPIRVRVFMEEGSITEIIIAESSEDPFVGGAAMDEMLEQVLLYNSTDIDAVSGATESSKAFLAAVENAIMKHE